MNDQTSHTVEDIKFAAEAIRNCPVGFDADALEGVLLLAAMSLFLEGCMPSAIERVALNQDRIIHYQGQGMAFGELAELTANVLLATLWLEEFWAGVCPDDPDPRAAFMDSIAELEELSFSRTIPAAFVVHAYLETDPDGRGELLALLAERTSQS